MGRLSAETIGGAVVDKPFAELAFPATPWGLYNGWPWFLPFAEWWYRVQDWVH